MPPQARDNPIPMEHRQVVYYLGIPHEQIVSAQEVSVVPHVYRLHLRKGGREWRGEVTVPDTGKVVTTDIDDLLTHSQDCPTCHGSGRVPRA